MAKHKPILIGCPQHRRLIRGSYECDGDGRYRLGPDGAFVLQRVRCGHNGGRCMQTLCVLHRFNQGGAASWYPSQILALDEPPTPRRRRRPSPPPASADSRMDVLC
jgi:hypothetical protein